MRHVNYRPKNSFELVLLKQQLRSEVQLNEEKIGFQFKYLRNSFKELAISSARYYAQKLASQFLKQLLLAKMKDR